LLSLKVVHAGADWWLQGRCQFTYCNDHLLTRNVQETSESVIEMHDDNPDHFEIMLKYLYTKHYQISEKSRLAPQLVENFIHPIGVHLLADKYEVEGLCSAAVDAFGCLSHWDPEKCAFKLDVAGLNEMVGVHYGACEIVGSGMGNCIVDFLFQHRKFHTMASDIKRLVHRFPAFGADIVMEEIRLGCLGSCTKKHR